MSEADADRRSEPRIRAMNLVHVEEYGIPTLDDFKTDEAIGKTLDLSHDGMRLQLDHCLPMRTRVKLDLALGNRVLQLEGRVRSASVLDDVLCELGIEFVDVKPEDYDALSEYLELRGD